MAKTRITASKERGKVVVRYDGEVIRTLEPKEAIECGGDIAAAAKKPYSNAESSAEGDYPDNKSSSNRARSKKSDDDDGDDWKGSNKNSLINGSL